MSENFSYPSVVVHSLGDALATLAIGSPVALVSAPAAGVYGGVMWWQGLVRNAMARYPSVTVVDFLDCGPAAGRAVEALRLDQKHLIVDLPDHLFEALVPLADEASATLYRNRPKALDLGNPRARGQLEAWLRAC